MRLEADGFVFRQAAVSRIFRDAVLEAYPRLADEDATAAAYRRMMQYVLLSSFTDRETGEIVVPYEAVAALVGIPAQKRGFRASDWLDDFLREVAPLDPLSHRFFSSRARTIRPELREEVLTALGHEAQRRRDETERVWFDTGDSVSIRAARAAQESAEASLAAISRASVDEDHPAREVICYLLNEPQARATKIFCENFPRVQEAVHQMPAGPAATAVERRRCEWCEGLLVNLRAFCRLYYAGSDKTPRVFAIGPNLHQLPSDMRRLAFAGCVEFDLRSAQLSIVARLWQIPRLQDFLRSGCSIWDALCSGNMNVDDGSDTCDADDVMAGVDVRVHKPILKRTAYSIIFGMTRRRLHRQLSEGTSIDAGVGDAAATAILQNPLLRSLLAARNRETRAILAKGGAADAWGRWIAKSPAREARSILSEVVQSYEMRLMLPALAVLRREPQVYLVSWLHDGITVFFGNASKRAYQIDRIRRAVQAEAKAADFETELDVKFL